MTHASEVRSESDPSDDDVCRVLHEEIGRLPDRFRGAVVLCYLEGLTHEMAAEQSGCPVGTIRSRLATARAKLRKRLDPPRRVPRMHTDRSGRIGAGFELGISRVSGNGFSGASGCYRVRGPAGWTGQGRADGDRFHRSRYVNGRGFDDNDDDEADTRDDDGRGRGIGDHLGGSGGLFRTSPRYWSRSRASGRAESAEGECRKTGSAAAAGECRKTGSAAAGGP